MEIEKQETPQKFKKWANNISSAAGRASNIGFTTPQAKGKTESVIVQNSQTKMTPNGSRLTQYDTSHMQVMTTTMVSTPPAKRFQQKIRNPFEAALAERLHLPLIASPSLFQRPTTPQLSSTQFEWTIDEVSSLQPANVEVHETQFHDSPDPEYEAKAQMAISSYFKEQQIVPSPVDCPLRNHRIILSELNANTPISKPGRRIRDFGTQTELTLPFNLPKELEEALKPYFQPQLAGIGKEFRGAGYRQTNSTGETFKDVSLRRKLFDMQNIVIVDNDGTTNSPLPNGNREPSDKSWSPIRTAIVGKLSDSLDKSTCSSMSPISTYDGLSFCSHSPAQSSPTRRKIRLRDFGDELSPILPNPQKRSIVKQDRKSTDRLCYRNENKNLETTLNDLSAIEDSNNRGFNSGKLEFSPDRSSSPIASNDRNAMSNIGNFSTDSFNIKISRLAVTNTKPSGNSCTKTLLEPHDEVELFLPDETNEILDDDEDDMQVSQLSMHSSNCSSSNSDTPRKKRRSASRKNLSQSFSASWLQADDDGDYEVPKINTPPSILITQLEGSSSTKENVHKDLVTNKIGENTKVNFYRTDSGFNEMTTSSSVTSSQDELSRDTGSIPVGFHDVSMANYHGQ